MKKTKRKFNRIAICLPHNYSHFQKEFLFSLFVMQQHFYEWVVRNKRMDSLSLIIQNGYNLDAMRNDLVEEAINSKHTHLLWLDTDIAFPNNMIQIMIEDLEDNENKGVEAITGIYTYKTPPYLPQLYPKYNRKTNKFGIAACFPLNQLFQVEGAGTGCLMIKASVFKRTKRPWFKFVSRSKGKNPINKYGEIETRIPWGMGEDLYMFLKCQPLTICDPRIQCTHFKTKGYGLKDYFDYNNIKVENNGFSLTSEQIKNIDQEHTKNVIKRQI